MKNTRMLLLVPAALLAAACGRDTKTDDALKNDLALASQAQPFNPQQVTSAAEMGYAYNPYTGQFQPVPTGLTAASPTVRPVSTTRRATTRRASSSGSSRVVYADPGPAPAPTVKRNTKRDAVIGAAAGAVIGATTSRDKMKGAVIGAVAGGVLGGIIGRTVDVQKNP